MQSPSPCGGLIGQYNRDPYWCRVWPSALALAQLILQHPKLVAGKSVCDIGSGLGLAGIAAALAGKLQKFHKCESGPLLMLYCIWDYPLQQLGLMQVS